MRPESLQLRWQRMAQERPTTVLEAGAEFVPIDIPFTPSAFEKVVRTLEVARACFPQPLPRDLHDVDLYFGRTMSATVLVHLLSIDLLRKRKDGLLIAAPPQPGTPRAAWVKASADDVHERLPVGRMVPNYAMRPSKTSNT